MTSTISKTYETASKILAVVMLSILNFYTTKIGSFMISEALCVQKSMKPPPTTMPKVKFCIF